MNAIQAWAERGVISLCLFGACLAEAGALPGKMAAWGYNAYGQTNVPPGLSNVVAIAAGQMDSLALQSSGKVVAWGMYWNGSAEVAMTVPAGLSNVVAIAAGADHCLALRTNGTVVAWGYNGSGQTNVPSRLRNPVAIAAGSAHSLALQNNGTVMAWGYNGSGQTTVPAGLSNVVAIAGGDMDSLALQNDGTVVAWGKYWDGSAEVPMTVPEGLSDVVAIAAGADHSLALQSNGTVVAWGYNGSGQTDIPLVLSNVVAIAAGADHSLALQADGTVVAWGYNGSGQASVPPGLSNLVAIAGGYYHSLAITIGPQIVSNPPPAISLAVGARTNLSVVVWSPSAFGCQWSLNGLPIPWATGTSLVVTNFDLKKAGAYSVTVTNCCFQTTGAASVVRLTNSPVVLVDGVDVGGGSVTPVHLPQIVMSSTFGPSAEIYYTLDGSEPDFSATPYSDPFPLTDSATIRAIAYNNSAYTNWAEAAAIFVQVWPTYPLLATASDGGSISVTPDPYVETNLYASDTLVTLTATPSNGWAFVSWTGDSADTTNVTTVLMDQPRTVQAVFEALPTYPLEASTAGGGSVSTNPAPFSEGNLYVSNTVVTLTATPSSGWSFLYWTGDSTDTNTVTQVVMDGPRTVQAVFGTSLNVVTNGSGKVLTNPPTGPYLFGSTVQLTALPLPDYYFYGWANAATGFANPLMFTVTNATPGLTALFKALKANQVSLTVPVIGGGTVVADPSTNVYQRGDPVTLTAVAAADYVFTGWSGDFLGSTNPLTLTLDASKVVTATFTAATNLSSSLQVMLGPADAVSAGARWQVDGGPWQNSGTVLSNLTLGAHTVSFLPLHSWITPSNETVTVVYGQTTTLTNTYIPLGSLQVFITPIGAVSAGARWQVDGSAWQTSGSVVSNLVAGILHTVSFTNIPGWTTPSSQTVTVNLNQTAVTTAIYVQQFGNLKVELSPAGAVSAGAQWQVDGGPWQPGGTTLTNLAVGNHTVAFTNLFGWTTPSNQTVTITMGQTAVVTGVYVRQFGSLQVTLLPSGAIIAGGQWRLDDGAWQNSGAVLLSIPVAAHTVSFSAIGGWVAPPAQSVTITANQTNSITGVYADLSYNYVTIAGTARSSGSADGTNTSALFDTPVGMALDMNSNLFIADTGNSVIRKLTPTTNGWVSSTIAGLAGYPGNSDGTNRQARFDYPTGVAMDTNGNVYVADQVNSTVRRISPSGTNWVVSTIAGLAGNNGSADGTNAVARFYFPAGVAVDLAGNVYVADQINSTVRKLTPLGSNNWAVTTIAGLAGYPGSTDGTNNAARFYWPSDLSVDVSGNIYVADTFNDTIRKIAPVGTNFLVSTVCGMAGVNGSVDGTNSGALLDGPGGISVDVSGNLFVADSYSSVIRKITPVGTNWVVNTVGGLAYATGTTDGTNSVARFDGPYGICANAGGTIFVADTDNDTIRAGSPVYPLPPVPNFTAVSVTTAALGFSWSAVPGLFYQIQYKTNLLQPNWSSLGSAALATSGTMSGSDSTGADRQRFYRVVVLP